jgi:hypothetical protein
MNQPIKQTLQDYINKEEPIGRINKNRMIRLIKLIKNNGIK